MVILMSICDYKYCHLSTASSNFNESLSFLCFHYHWKAFWIVEKIKIVKDDCNFCYTHLLTMIFFLSDFSPCLMKVLHRGQTLAYTLRTLTLKYDFKIDICIILCSKIDWNKYSWSLTKILILFSTLVVSWDKNNCLSTFLFFLSG